MKERQRIEERKTFCKADKEFVLMKSGGRCSHCGKKLSVSDDFTIEHIIPLSKGGTNQHQNIVALCNACNQEKANNIVSPLDYYRYLRGEYMEDVLNMYAEYNDEFSYFNSKNLLFTDIIQTTSPHFVYDGGGNVKTCVLKEGSFKKAKYYDLDKIYNTYRSYLRKHKMDMSGVKNFLSEIFKLGCIYFQTNRAGDITLVLPFVVISEEGFRTLSLVYPLCVYNKMNYYSSYADFMSELFATLESRLDSGLIMVDGYFLKDGNSWKMSVFFKTPFRDHCWTRYEESESSYFGSLLNKKPSDEEVESYIKDTQKYFTTYMKLEDLRLI